MLSNSHPRSVSLRLFISAASHQEDHGEIMVPLCRLHHESINTRTLRVVRCVVKTDRVVDGGGDVVNFRAELKVKVAYNECPLTARVRLGIAHAGFVLLPFRVEKIAGQTCNPCREQKKGIAKTAWNNCGHKCEWMVHCHHSNKGRNS